MKLQHVDPLVTFEAADHSAETLEAKDLFRYHELLMKGSENGSPGSDTYAKLIREAAQHGPIRVIVTDRIDNQAFTSYKKNYTEIYINPSFIPDARVAAARESLLFEVNNASKRTAMRALDKAASRGDLSGYEQRLGRTDLRLLQSFKGDINNEHDRFRVIRAREKARLEFNNGPMLVQIDAEMTSKRLPTCGATSGWNWNDFDHFLDRQIDMKQTDDYLKEYDGLIPKQSHSTVAPSFTAGSTTASPASYSYDPVRDTGQSSFTFPSPGITPATTASSLYSNPFDTLSSQVRAALPNAAPATIATASDEYASGLAEYQPPAEPCWQRVGNSYLWARPGEASTNYFARLDVVGQTHRDKAEVWQEVDVKSGVLDPDATPCTISVRVISGNLQFDPIYPGEFARYVDRTQHEGPEALQTSRKHARQRDRLPTDGPRAKYHKVERNRSPDRGQRR
jgi:hypothetical protein